MVAPTAGLWSSERSAPPLDMATARKLIATAPPVTSAPDTMTAASGAGGIRKQSAANVTAAVPPTIAAHARALAASKRPSGTGTARRIQKARRSACMWVSGPSVVM